MEEDSCAIIPIIYGNDLNLHFSITHNTSLYGLTNSQYRALLVVRRNLQNVSLIRSLQAKVASIRPSSRTTRNQNEAASRDSASGSCAVGDTCHTSAGREVSKNDVVCHYVINV